MKFYTIGFTQKSAEEFFELLKCNYVDTLIDVRINNKSQLAGFAKGRDLKYFLREICNIEYIYEEQFAPTKELLDDWKKQKIIWEEYEYLYRRILYKRNVHKLFAEKYYDELKNKSVCFLCSEATPEFCHRRLLVEYIKEFCPETNDVLINHL